MRYKMVMIGAAMALLAGPALADPKDYRFEPVSDQITVSPTAPVAVRLIHIPSNKPVPGAIVFQPKMEMPMGSMAPMPTKITQAAPDSKGTYPFVADISMAGPWILTVSAKVQGETATITGSVPFTATKMNPGAMDGKMDHDHMQH